MDDYEVKLTGKAQRQLQEIVRYIAEDLQEPATAERMLDSMEKEIIDRKSTRLNSSHSGQSRMPSSA